MSPSTRRAFLYRLALTPAAIAWAAEVWGKDATARRLKFGAITDLHHDVMPDGPERLGAFLAAMQKASPDFVIQMGDFCQPQERNKPLMELWNSHHGSRYHVIGNHDMDGGFKPDQTAAFFGMPARYYAFDAGPVRCLVLDGNESGGKIKGYKRFISAAQAKWLAHQLESSDRPVIVFVHQPIDDQPGGVENAAEIRGLLKKAEQAKPGRVAAVFSGHLHQDYQRVIDGIPYIQINSASYYWLGNPKSARETYPAAVHKTYPSLRNVAAYRDPLWAVVTLDFGSGELAIEGRRSQWVGPDPWQRGETAPPHDSVRPEISDRKLKVLG